MEVELKLTDFKKDQVTVVMPVWTPGSYLVREYARNLEKETDPELKEKLWKEDPGS